MWVEAANFVITILDRFGAPIAIILIAIAIFWRLLWPFWAERLWPFIERVYDDYRAEKANIQAQYLAERRADQAVFIKTINDTRLAFENNLSIERELRGLESKKLVESLDKIHTQIEALGDKK